MSNKEADQILIQQYALCLGTTLERLLKNKPDRETAKKKHVIMYALRQKEFTWKRIAKIFNLRQHGSCIYASNKVSNHRKVYKDIKEMVERCV